MVKTNPFKTELDLLKGALDNQKRNLTARNKRGQYNVTETRKINATLKKARALLNTVNFM